MISVGDYFVKTSQTYYFGLLIVSSIDDYYTDLTFVLRPSDSYHVPHSFKQKTFCTDNTKHVCHKLLRMATQEEIYEAKLKRMLI